MRSKIASRDTQEDRKHGRPAALQAGAHSKAVSRNTVQVPTDRRSTIENKREKQECKEQYVKQDREQKFAQDCRFKK